MSATERNIASARASNPARKSRITVAQLFVRAFRRWQRNRAMNALSRLDNRQLEDIGISRNDIPRVVEGLFSPEEANAKATPRVVYEGDTAVIPVSSNQRAA